MRPGRSGRSESGDDRGELRRPDAGCLVVAGGGREQAVVGRGLLQLPVAGDVVEVLAGVSVEPGVHQRVDVAGPVAVEAVAVGDQRAPQRGRQAGPADREPARDRLAAAEGGAVAVGRARVARAVLRVAGVRVRVGRDVWLLAAGGARLGQRASGLAVGDGLARVGLGLAVHARAALVERTAPELAGSAAAGAGLGAPEVAALPVVVGRGRLVAAEVVDVPDGLGALGRGARVGLGTGVVALERGAADAGHPRLG